MRICIWPKNNEKNNTNFVNNFIYKIERLFKTILTVNQTQKQLFMITLIKP